jgi:putative serine protease PepD
MISTGFVEAAFGVRAQDPWHLPNTERAPMPTTLHPPSDRPPLWYGDQRPPDRGGDDPPPPPAPPRDRPPRRSRLVALMLVCALLGGGASTAILAAAGVFHDDGNATTTTVLRSVSNTGSSSSSSGLNAGALYASVSPGVVDITSKGVSSGSNQSNPFGGPQQQSESTATGTGFVVDGQGHIVTAAHVVDGASSITVKFSDGTSRKATVTGKDDATDVAVLKVDPSGLTLHPLKLASSASLDVGQSVAAIGDPFGYARSISTGIVSGVDRTISAPNGFTVAHAIQTDAALNPGNSGGPLLNAKGEVVGIVDQIATDGNAEQSSGVGFAVPVDLVKSQLPTLEAGKKVEHAYLGVATSDAPNQTGGAAIGQVTSGGPAAGAGIRSGDVITKLGDATVGNSSDLVAAIADHHPGDKVKVTIRRGSSTIERTVTLGTQPAQSSNQG